MEPAAATADFESQPGVLPTAEPQPEPSVLFGEPSEVQAPYSERTGTFSQVGSHLSMLFTSLCCCKDLAGEIKKPLLLASPCELPGP